MADAPDWYTPEEETPAATPAAPAAQATAPDWYTPEPPPPPATNDQQGFPYDDPKYTYGTLFPFRTETNPADRKTASQSGGVLPFIWDHLAIPEAVRAPLRGAISMGQQAAGATDQFSERPPTPDEMATFATLVGIRGAGAKTVVPAKAAEANPAIARALTQQEQFAATPVGQYQAPAAATVNAMGTAASPAQIGQNAIAKATDFLAREKAARGAALDAVEAPFISSAPSPRAAQLTGQYEATPALPAEGMPPPSQNPKIARLAQLQQERLAANAGLPAAGDPSRSFAAIAAGPNPAAPVVAGARAEMPSTLDIITKPSEGPPKPAIFGQLQKQLNDSNGTLPYSELKDWRSRVGEAIDGAQGGEGTGQLKQLYKGLTDDMKSHLRANGGDEAVDAFNAANEGYKDLQKTVENHIGNLTNGSTTPETVFNSLAANPAQSATRLQALVDKGVLDQNDIGSIASNWLQRAGTNTEGHYDPVQLTRAVTKLQKDSPEAFNLLFRQGGRSDAFDAGMAQANRLASVQSSVAKANPPKPGVLDTIKKAAKGLAMATGMSHLPVVGPVGGELVGGLLGIGEGAARGAAGNPLYAIPRAPYSVTGYLKALQARSAAGAPTVGRAIRAGAIVPTLQPPNGP